MVKRYDYLQLLASKVTEELVITTIAGTAKEWNHLKPRDANLLGVYMSGATPLALGVALSLPHRRIICLDADGSLLMGLSVFPTIASKNPSNLIVIVFDNECYEAGGNTPTFTAGPADLSEIARGAGIKNSFMVRELSEFEKAIDEAYRANGATVIIVKVSAGTAALEAPAMEGAENKYRFARHIEETENMKIFKSAKIEKPK